MAPIYLIVVTKATTFSRALYNIVSATPETQTCAYPENNEEFFYINIRITHPTTNRSTILKMEVLKEAHVLSVEVPGRQKTLPLAEQALGNRVDAEYSDRRLKRESFEMVWRFEQADDVEGKYKDEARKVSVDIMARDLKTTWWDVYECELG
ncbi:uncharacterized protein J4E92_005270 [Alternaria infectoria]|uniref:uncharacterized protein n=1 Tax=Alternaria infectoria TaxID=45303 RepID=UPI002220C6EC|nr:uncharacterized protein J4E92_005270 [Alternaria infectoria]KAI4929605.1 hypothetical protein J4E92_005270 [Alternaria infectoria]